jgi:hypothetical protein
MAVRRGGLAVARTDARVAAMTTLKMPACEVDGCGLDATHLAEYYGPHPFVVRGAVWCCDRHRRLVLVLAERWDLNLSMTPRWDVYAGSVVPPW